MIQFHRACMLIFICCMVAIHTSAQETQVDSVLEMLTEIRQADGFDTTKFIDGLARLSYIEMTDARIAAVEAAAWEMYERGDENLCYLVRTAIFLSLIYSDVDKAIAYGQKNLNELETASWPYSAWLRSFILKSLRLPYRNSGQINEGITYFSQTLVEAKSKNDTLTLADCHYVLGGFYNGIALMDQAIYHMQKSISYMDSVPDEMYFGLPNPKGKILYLSNHYVLGVFYQESGENQKASAQFTYVRKMSGSNAELRSIAAKGAAQTFLAMDSLQPVPELIRIARANSSGSRQDPYLVALNQLEAWYFIKTSRFAEAEALLEESWELIERENFPAAPPAGIIKPDYYFALLRKAQGEYREAIAFLEKDIEWVSHQRSEVLKDYKLLAELNLEIGEGTKAAEAFANYIDLQDAILTEQAAFRVSSFELEQQMNERELSIANLESENRIAGLIRNFTVGLAILLLALALAVFNRYKTKQKDNRLLSATLSNLKSTQAQLIQSEKMASLGELTAGIAHEIQNPLNFVNNFSEVSAELIDEVRDDLKAVQTRFTASLGVTASEDDQDILSDAEATLSDIKQNLEKITHHGKRADAIVKGMLAHSRSGKGEKAPTDINALAEEYLKLAYHGLRAKDKSFNADFKTYLDTNLPKINVVPQDIGRVLLNLINNAFQAVYEKSNKGESGYKPEVSVETKLKTNNQILITVRDNGPGIPDSIKDKIFQPFFTTKPTGHGTGLGLSLSYDIVKAHGGELSVKTHLDKVETKNGEGSMFEILLPINESLSK